jgi:hypothetical protein
MRHVHFPSKNDILSELRVSFSQDTFDWVKVLSNELELRPR